jgi:hypothetical protein
MQLDLIQKPQNARFSSAVGAKRTTRQTSIYRRAARLPETLLGDLVALLSFATAVGIVVHLILGMG